MKKSSYSASEKAEYNKQRIQEMTNELETKLEDIYNGKDYAAFLRMMALFPQYSLNNQALILCQKPEASYVCSYNNWKKLNRQVNAKAKAIHIFAPVPKKYETEVDKRDEEGNLVFDEEGHIEKEKVSRSYMNFRLVPVFDISDTNGDPLPTLTISELDDKGEVTNYDEVFSYLEQISPVPIRFDDISGEAKGYFSNSAQEIVLGKGYGHTQTLKTLIHEIAHSILHNKEKKDLLKGIDVVKSNRIDKEMQAESVAYVIATYLGFDTSDYSLGYITGWSSGYHNDADKEAEIKAFRNSLEAIRECAAYIINELETRSHFIEENPQMYFTYEITTCAEFSSLATVTEYDNIVDAVKAYAKLQNTTDIKGMNIIIHDQRGGDHAIFDGAEIDVLRANVLIDYIAERYYEMYPELKTVMDVIVKTWNKEMAISSAKQKALIRHKHPKMPLKAKKKRKDPDR